MSNQQSPEPLLIYRENSLGTKRQIHVFRDRVEISGDEVLAGSAQYSVPLRTLNPIPVRGTYRNQWFNIGCLAGLLWGAAYYVFSRIPSIDLMDSRWGFFWAVPLFSLVLIAVTAKRTPFASFVNDAGVMVFGFARNYPDHRKFDAVVLQLSQLIREERQVATAAGLEQRTTWDS